MSSRSFAGAVCLTFGLTGALAAQSASQNPTQQPPATDTMAQQHTVTVEGCLVREKDVPGRQPNVAERQGVMEDFILTNAKVIKGSPHTSAGATGTTGSTSATGAQPGQQPAGTSGISAMMFEVRGIEDTQLQQYVGQRVEIEGKIDPADLAERSREKANPAGEPAGDLPELKGAVIRKASSSEPCTPVAPKK
jgi:hypothetical protein